MVVKHSSDFQVAEDEPKVSILVVDDEEMILTMMESLLKSFGYHVLTAPAGAQALRVAQAHSFDIALLDYQLPDTTGIELMNQLTPLIPGLHTIIITGHGSIERAVEAMQAGAWDFISKPVLPNMLQQKLKRLEEVSLLQREHVFHQKALQGEFDFSGVVGISPVMRHVYEAVLRAGASALPVLIEGETGCGKEYIAEAIHLNSNRRGKPFIVLDCNATPSTLFEATLFGSSRGAFTGAIERKGLLELADEGTLFLDEVGEISLELQPKLLRCLETRRFRPVGATREITSNFRIICATNRNLLDETKSGNFRTDLFYRISAQRVQVPPLRERSSDIPVFAKHFLSEITKIHHSEPMTFTSKALQKLCNYSWPGNIRQLKFTIESAFFSCSEPKIDAKHIFLDGEEQDREPDHSLHPVDLGMDLKTYREQVLQQAERNYIMALLEENQGDVRKSARQAGITREALYRIMSRCNLDPGQFRE